MATTDLPISKQLSVGAIVYYIKEGVPYVVLLEQNNAHYNRKGDDLKRKVIDVGPCGGINEGEDPLECAAREVEEETGITPEIDYSFRSEFSYAIPTPVIARSGPWEGKLCTVEKTRRYYAARTTETEAEKVRKSEEHVAIHKLPLEKAISMYQQMSKEPLYRGKTDEFAQKIGILEEFKAWLIESKRISTS